MKYIWNLFIYGTLIFSNFLLRNSNLFKWFCCIPYDYNNKINEAYQKKIECFFLFLKENTQKLFLFSLLFLPDSSIML